MNKLSVFFLFVIAICQMALAEATYTVEARVGAFFPTDNRFNRFYGHVLPTYQVEVGMDTCYCVDLFANVDFFYRDHARRSCCKSSVDVLNFSFGIKYVRCFCDCFSYYVGIGPVLGNVWVDNKLCYCDNRKHRRSKFAGGGIIKTGIYVNLCDNIFADIFLDYVYEPVCFHRTVDVGGLRTGLGIGLAF